MCLRVFGIGVTDAIAGEQTEGVVVDVKTCWWIKINTKPVRRHMMDGAVFPHIIRFTYTVEGKEYAGSRYVNWNVRCPVKDEVITVYYDVENPAKYAVLI